MCNNLVIRKRCGHAVINTFVFFFHKTTFTPPCTKLCDPLSGYRCSCHPSLTPPTQGFPCYDSLPHPPLIAFLEHLRVNPAFLNQVHYARQAAALAFCIGLQFPLCFPSETSTDHLTRCLENFLTGRKKKKKSLKSLWYG